MLDKLKEENCSICALSESKSNKILDLKKYFLIGDKNKTYRYLCRNCNNKIDKSNMYIQCSECKGYFEFGKMLFGKPRYLDDNCEFLDLLRPQFICCEVCSIDVNIRILQEKLSKIDELKDFVVDRSNYKQIIKSFEEKLNSLNKKFTTKE